MTRTESFSSISTYVNCPRKFFYIYKLGLPRKPSIEKHIGTVIHKTLEKFFELDIEKINPENYEADFRQHLFEVFISCWLNNLDGLKKIGCDKAVIQDYYNQCLMMMNNFLVIFFERLRGKIEEHGLYNGFLKVKPVTEMKLFSERYNLVGFLDAIYEMGEERMVIDYKTGKSDELDNDNLLQAGIYGLLFYENFGVVPNKACFLFLRTGRECFVDVNDEIIEGARREIERIRIKAITDDINDYEKRMSRLCKWGNGQCEFYPLCFLGKTVEEYKEEYKAMVEE